MIQSEDAETWRGEWVREVTVAGRERFQSCSFAQTHRRTYCTILRARYHQFMNNACSQLLSLFSCVIVIIETDCSISGFYSVSVNFDVFFSQCFCSVSLIVVNKLRCAYEMVTIQGHMNICPRSRRCLLKTYHPEGSLSSRRNSL